jgi:hypothetical protein
MLDGIPKRIEPIYVVKARKYRRRFLKKPFSAMLLRDWGYPPPISRYPNGRGGGGGLGCPESGREKGFRYSSP